MPANRYVHIGYFQSCGLNVLNGFFFSLESGTHIKDSHSLQKQKSKKRQGPFTGNSEGSNCLLVLTGAVKRQE